MFDKARARAGTAALTIGVMAAACIYRVSEDTGIAWWVILLALVVLAMLAGTLATVAACMLSSAISRREERES